MGATLYTVQGTLFRGVSEGNLNSFALVLVRTKQGSLLAAIKARAIADTDGSALKNECSERYMHPYFTL